MTIEETIKKAIEGGYHKFQLNPVGHIEERQWRRVGYSEFDLYKSIFDDPAFWSALGKAMGWGIIGHARLGRMCSNTTCGCENESEWLYHWHRFIDHLAAGKTAEEFFKDL